MKSNYFKKVIKSRSVIGAVFCVCIMLASMATAIDIMKNTEKTTNEVKSLSYTFLFKTPSLKISEVNNKDFTSIELEGCLGIGKSAGWPTLPIKPISLLLPPMKTVSNVQVIGTSKVLDLNGFNLVEKPVFPYQNEVPIGSPPGEFIIDDSLYSTNAVYPSSLKDDYQIGYSRGYTIFNTILSPIQYNPAEGKLYYYPEMTINIELTDTQNANSFYRDNLDDKAWVEKLVYNPEITELYTPDILQPLDYPGGLCDPSDHYDYVIITTTHEDLDYWDTTSTIPYNWQSLMDKHEADDGLSCTLVTVQDIDACTDYQNSDPLFNDKQAHIREFSKDAYQDWGTEYILIGGDDEWIPARHMDTNYETQIDSDIYWSNLDSTFNEDHDYSWGESGDNGFDLYTEIYIGRLTCDEPQDVSNWMKKSFYYADSIEAEYLDNGGFYGGKMGWECEGDDFVDYSSIKGTDNWLGPVPDEDGPFPTWAGFQFGFETWNSENPDNQYNLDEKWTQNPPNPGWQSGGTTAFRDAINNDKITLISCMAHADSTMSLDVYMSEWESSYTNTKPFFVHDMGCHCGDMDASDDGVLHSMLFHSDTELAFACAYNTCYGWGNWRNTNTSSCFQEKEFWSYFFDLENKSGDFSNWQFGKGHAFSKDRMAPTINWETSQQPGSWRAIIEGCLLFGDPAQKLKSPHTSEPPATPDAPDGPTEWVQNLDCEFNAITTDPDGDQILYLFDWGDGTMSNWLGPYSSGQEGQGYHSYADLGEYQVKVRVRDVWGAVSDWSEPSTITIIVNSPPNKPTIDGPTNIKAIKQYTYTVSAVDPNDHDIYYYVWWDDGDYEDWIGPYTSGEEVTVKNAWPEVGTFTIQVKAMDFIGDKSEITTLQITVTKGREINNPILFQFLEKIINHFPQLERFLK